MIEENMSMTTLWATIITLILSGLSLIVSVISLIKASKAQDIQNLVNEMDARLKQYELDRITAAQIEAIEAIVEARVVRISDKKTRLKIWNSGNIAVYNVSAKFDEGTDIYILDHGKMPYDILEPGKSFEIPVVTHFGSASKFWITLTWDDGEGNCQERRQISDL